jgi:hypothetical protein
MAFLLESSLMAYSHHPVHVQSIYETASFCMQNGWERVEVLLAVGTQQNSAYRAHFVYWMDFLVWIRHNTSRGTPSGNYCKLFNCCEYDGGSLIFYPCEHSRMPTILLSRLLYHHQVSRLLPAIRRQSSGIRPAPPRVRVTRWIETEIISPPVL